MFLETSTQIVDYTKSNIDLHIVFDKLIGLLNITPWIDSGEYNICTMSNMAIFSPWFSNELHKLKFSIKYKDGSIKPIQFMNYIISPDECLGLIFIGLKLDGKDKIKLNNMIEQLKLPLVESVSA